ncbi:DUF1963 domain-containing protein [Micromonospora sp. PLK6-60]|uniref:DUF1963 domain-containing protein n=1 Tax=Micromonospora sp. PLK6-60 TaxID=2873383 RepID=UPI001CA70358|nr:DUF1963 domain-containing protein [Micromonospora sp. PLK6-60]MBY8875683.1 DUF1963 domain-containing protein [Micromonospora sp. PLK6-60]
MDHYLQFHQVATARGFAADEIDAFARLLRFTIAARPGRDGADVGRSTNPPTGPAADVVVGRAGGRPRLPADLPWPSSPGGLLLPFVATFDCAALPRVAGLPLPVDGSLLVFLDHEVAAYEVDDHAKEQEYARIIHLPAGTPTVPAEVPENSPRTDPDRFLGSEHELYAVVQASLPGWLDQDEDDEPGLSDFQRQSARALPHRSGLCALVDELWPAVRSTEFQLGGYGWEVGEMAGHVYVTPEFLIAEANLRARKKAGDLVVSSSKEENFLVEEELQRVAGEWIPLIQFVTGRQLYRGRFLIRVDDLAAGRLDRAVSWTAFTE